MEQNDKNEYWLIQLDYDNIDLLRSNYSSEEEAREAMSRTDYQAIIVLGKIIASEA